jgi:hypothetical protein
MSPLPQHPISSIVGVVLLVALAALAFSLSGCKNTYASCRQTIVATDAGVVTATTLHATGMISADDARPVSIAGHVLLDATTNWKASLDAGDTNGAAVAGRAATSALGQLTAQLVLLETHNQLPTHPQEGRYRLTLTNNRDDAAGDHRKKLGEVSAAVAILQIAADLTPQIVAWINAATAGDQVTAAEAQAALTSLARDLATLDTAIGQ